VQNVNRQFKLRQLRTRATHVHPWFGPLDAQGWHCLAAMHHTIHRRQVERIIKAQLYRRIGEAIMKTKGHREVE
jgi:hypothetical protein